MNIDYLVATRLRNEEVLDHINYEDMVDNLYDIQYACEDVLCVDNDTILSAIDDNEDLLQEYKFAFEELDSKAYILISDVTEFDISNEYNDCVNAIINYTHPDERKGLMRNTKADLFSLFTYTLNIIIRYCDIVADYRNLKGIYDMICEKDNQIGKTIKEINALYEKIAENKANSREYDNFLRLTESLPDEVWIR